MKRKAFVRAIALVAGLLPILAGLVPAQGTTAAIGFVGE